MITMVSALKAEMEPFIKALPKVESFPIGSGTLRNYDYLHLLNCGVGFQQASKTLEIYLQQYHPAQLIIIGFAGALNPALEINSLFNVTKILGEGEETKLKLPSLKGKNDLSNVSLLTVKKAVTSVTLKNQLWQQYQTDLVDMEAYYLAHLSLQNNIRTYVLKGITDLATDSARKQFKENYVQVRNKIFDVLKPLLLK